jgi:ABC-type phosphate/phosphonate transport system substrate-binding protein
VLRGWVDAGTTYVVRDDADRVVNSGWLELAQGDLRILSYTDPIPCDAIAHRPGLATGLIERIARAMVDVADTDDEGRAVLTDVFHASGMVRADLRIYDPIRDMLQRTKNR